MSERRSTSPLPGAGARWPFDIPRPGWLQIGRRVLREVSEDNLSLIAAGLAFFALLGIFPGLTVLVAVYGLLADPSTIRDQIAILRGVLPRDALELLSSQLGALLDSPASSHGVGLAISLVVLIWSSSSGTQTLVKAINLAYDEREHRSFIRLRLLALILTLAGLTFFLVSVAGIALLPAVLALFGLDQLTETLLMVLRWPFLGGVFLLALAVIYRLAPDRRAPKWRWVTLGSVTATVLWLVGSGLFSFYVTTFGRYSETYGTLGAVVVLLLWLYITAFVVLLGAEINAETEHQTAEDSTIGPERPLGQRRAWVADHRPEPARPKPLGPEAETPPLESKDRPPPERQGPESQSPESQSGT